MARYPFAICVVSYNGAGDLPGCLASIAAQTLSDIQVVIVDNASQDNSAEIAREMCPAAVRIVLPKNLGFTGGFNAAIRATDAEYVLVLNQDARLESDFCARAVSFLGQHPEVGSVNARVLRTSQDSLTKTTTEPTIDTCGLVIFKNHLVKNLGEDQPVSQYANSTELWGVCAAVAVYRKAALDDVAEMRDGVAQYFDEDFFMYQEDVDLAYRLKWRGWTAWYLADAVAYHSRTRKGGASRSNQQINYWSYRNHWYLLIKNASFGVILRCFPQVIFVEFAKFFYRGLWERGWFREFGEIGKNLSIMRVKRAEIMSCRKISDREMIRYFS